MIFYNLHIFLCHACQGYDQLRSSGLLQQPKSFMQGSQPFHQLPMLSPQHQQQLILAQQNLTSPSASDVESRRLRMLLSNRNSSMGKDGLSNSVGDVVPNMSSPSQGPCPVLPRGDQDILLKVPYLFLSRREMLAKFLLVLTMYCSVPHTFISIANY